MNADWGSRGRLGRKGKDLKKHKTEKKRQRGWLPSLRRNELKRRESEDGHKRPERMESESEERIPKETSKRNHKDSVIVQPLDIRDPEKFKA